MAARTFEDLIVWQKAYRFVLTLYRLTDSFPRHEIYGLTHQMRKAAVSIPANIAEGFKKRGKLDKVRFMNIAQGSTEESRCYLLLSNDLGYGDTKPLLGTLEEVGRLLECYSRAILNYGS
jgi:four helix bundle protein